VPPAPATARAVQDDGDAVESRIVPGVSPRFLEAMSWMLAIRPNQRPQSGDQLRAVLDGRAEIPPRGRPGFTVPGALAPSTGPQIEQVADATRINPAYLPTHMPPARVAPASDQRATTTFSPKAPMPTARQTPGEAPPLRPPGAPQPATPPGATANPPQARTAAAQPPAAGSQRPAPTQGAAAPAPRSAVSPPPAAARGPQGGPASAPAPLTGGGAAASAKRHDGPPSQPASLRREGPPSQPASLPHREGPPSQPASLSHREGPPSQPASWAASRPVTLPPGASGPSSRPPVNLPPASRPAPLAAAKAAPGTARRGASQSWLVLAGGGMFVVVAALAAWQFSGRRDAAGIEQASAASAPASSVVATPATPAQQIIIETPEPAPTSTLPNDAANSPLPTPAAPPADTTARASTADRAPIPEAGAASGARLRPPGKPVPRVGEDPPLAANNGSATIRPPESPPTTGLPNASVNGDRHGVPSTVPPRDPATGQRPAAESSGQTIRDVCKGSFFERNICLDQRCEEGRFRSTPECIDVLDRKRKRQSQ